MKKLFGALIFSALLLGLGVGPSLAETIPSIPSNATEKADKKLTKEARKADKAARKAAKKAEKAEKKARKAAKKAEKKALKDAKKAEKTM